MIQRFDEVILTKASKIDFRQFENLIKENYLTKEYFNKINQKNVTRIDEHYDYLTKLEDTLEFLNKEINK